MPLALAPQFTQITYTWTNWKTVYANKGGVYQYFDNGVNTTVYFYDEPEVYIAVMWDGTVPDPIIASGYSQAQNNSDLSDFQTNWLAGANKRISRTDQFGNPIITTFAQGLASKLIPSATASRSQGYVGT